MHRKGRLDKLRSVEQAIYEFEGERYTPSNERVVLKTEGIFDKRVSVSSTAMYGIYMTIFILFLLVVSLGPAM